MRAAAVGGAAYYAGKKVQGSRDEEPDAYGEPADEADAEPTAISDEAIEQLEKLSELKDKGVLTQEEFEGQKQKILGP